MIIGGMNGNTNAGAVNMGNPNMDSYSKSLQRQIANAQKSLQELSQDDKIDPDTKMKKRQEIQKQISDLTMQLRQHQIEERRKVQQEKQQKNQPKKLEDNALGLSKNSMEAMISADNSLKQAKVQGDTANQMQNGSNIKRSEIKLDGGGLKRSLNDNAAIRNKWDDVENMEQHAKAATASQMSLLAEAQDKLNKANTKDNTSMKTQKKSEEKAKTKAEEQETEGTVAAETIGTMVTMAKPEETTSVSNNPTKSAAVIGSNIDVKV